MWELILLLRANEGGISSREIKWSQPVKVFLFWVFWLGTAAGIFLLAMLTQPLLLQCGRGIWPADTLCQV